MNVPQVSVIIPIYKVPEIYLKRCIESVINQTLVDIEILLVDDGSPDCCREICNSYADRDNRIRCLHKQNGGLASARNYGFDHSHGEWVMFVDGDDWIEPDMCQTMYSVVQNHNVDIVLCGMIRDYGKRKEKYKYSLKANYVYSSSECAAFQQEVLNFNSNIATVTAKLYRKALLTCNGIRHNEKLKQGAEGIEFNFRIFGIIESAIFIDKWFYHYTYNNESITTNHNEQNHQYVLKCYEKIAQEIVSCDNSNVLNRWLNNRLIYVMITTAISGYFSPKNRESFFTKRKKYVEYLNRDILKEALMASETDGLSLSRKVTFYLIKYRCFLCISFFAKIRMLQKRVKGR